MFRPSPLLFSTGLLLLALLPHSVRAEWELAAGVGLRRATMTEYAPNGQSLVTERGWMPGVRARADYLLPTGRMGFSSELYNGNIDYRGRLQGGAPFATDTGTLQARLGAEYGHDLNESLRLIAGVEWDYWKRDIKGHSGAVGMNERYTSLRLLGGAEFVVLRAAPGTLRARTLLVAADRESMRVRFDGKVFDDAKMKTRDGSGARMALSFVPSALPTLTVGLEYDWMRIGRSADAVLRRNGAAVGTLAQPRHVRRALDVYASYTF